MATVTHVRSTDATANSTTMAVTNVTPTVGELLVVMTGASVTAVNAGCVDNKGGTYAMVTSGNWATSAHTRNIFVGNQLVSTSSMTITLGWTGDAKTGSGMTVFSVAGLSTTRLGSAAFKQSANLNNQTSAVSPTFTFGAAVSSSNPTLGFFTSLTSAAVMVPPTGWSESADFGNTTPSLGFESIFRNDTFNGTTGNFGSTTTSAWGMTMIELDTSVLTASATPAPVRTLLGVGR